MKPICLNSLRLVESGIPYFRNNVFVQVLFRATFRWDGEGKGKREEVVESTFPRSIMRQGEDSFYDNIVIIKMEL